MRDHDTPERISGGEKATATGDKKRRLCDKNGIRGGVDAGWKAW